MKDTLITKLYKRELTSPGVRTKSHRSLYSSHALIADLDIVNELDGHSGCVNALSWSKSGDLLASGSDDQHLNIHTFQPSTSDEQFKLTTTVATGHTQNIFSVKFMPFQNDRTVVTAAGDGEVRVFDLEYAGQAREASAASSLAGEGRRRGRNHLYDGVRYMSDGDTDARVYRSHGDRVKRIVTESSPHLFLTCSEDGEVRQWDLRQPSSAYPSPRGRYGSSSDTMVPPPLISYRRYNLDLNTISCSPSQPHYIALGGAHMHCFLHDRRMTGRDRLREAGKRLSPARSTHSDEDEMMSQATQCVRKFAPQGQQRMKRTENGHITACKISDARPDEMMVSWSGDHIYSFDLLRSPDAGGQTAQRVSGLMASESRRAKQSRDRKRKRKTNASDTSLGQREAATRGSSRPRTGQSGEVAALRVRYQNGQSEDIPISGEQAPLQWGIHALTEKQRDALRIAKATVRIRSSLFASQKASEEPSNRFTATLGEAASIISDINEAMRDWRYPMDPHAEMVVVEQTLRRDRESARRLVQAAGTLSRVLGGKLRTGSAGPSPLLAHFASVEARSNDLQPTQKEQFGYDFLKAILLFLESGVGRLIEGFTRPREMLPDVKAARRLPIPENEATTEAIDDNLIPYLLGLASDKPVVDLETNRFETDERRQLFATEKAAVMAFAGASRISFADLSSEEGEESVQAQDRETARRFWGLKVARGVLLNAAEGVDYVFVDRAFGGVGRVVREMQEIEEGLGEAGGEENDEVVENVEMLDATGTAVDGAAAEDIAAASREMSDGQRAAAGDEPQLFANDDEVMDDDEFDTSPAHSSDEEDSSEPDEIDGVPNLPRGFPRFMINSPFERRRHKEHVEAHVPCSSSTRVYRGHCNVRTVKDVNYFGLDDEYVVSGSDDGNLFVWDRKSGVVVNILEGDGEVVNVAQGHPYEMCLAVSGIDHTIKIFSPDGRARAKARRGEGVEAHDASQFSSLAFPHRLGRRRGQLRRAGASGEAAVTSEPAIARAEQQAAMDAYEDEDYVAPTGLASRKRLHDAYRITSKNDVERQGGNQDAYITVPHAQLLQLLFSNMGNVGIVPTLH